MLFDEALGEGEVGEEEGETLGDGEEAFGAWVLVPKTELEEPPGDIELAVSSPFATVPLTVTIGPTEGVDSFPESN